MHSTQLTIIVPTVRRPDTLYHTLRTIISQDYSNFKIIVSDNFSNDNTKEVVDAFADSRITYINPGHRLPMSQHWEFALKHVDEGYVTILGDDDGMLPGALKQAASILNKHNVPAIGWKFGYFNWKGLPPFFMIPMAGYYRVVDAKTEIEKIFGETIYNTIKFPSFYGGFINIDLVKKLKEKYGGYFFHSRIPDFFSGAMIAASVDKYIRLEFPLTINAASKHSTGFALSNKDKDQQAFLDIQKGNDNIAFHPSLIFVRSFIAAISEPMLQVHKLNPSFPVLDARKIIREMSAEAVSAPDKEKFEELKQGIAGIAALNGLSDYANDLLAQVTHNPQPATVKKKFSPVSQSLYVDTTNTDIENVEDACNFAAAVIPRNYAELKKGAFMNYFRVKSTVLYLYLKLFSKKRRYL